ncbi:MAG TPA: hypothetical protein VKN99_13100 [Polyangia bacterium]|nr:hypothetical protein [Polyangia bacterium]
MKLRRFVVRLAPYLLAALVIAVLLRKYRPSDIAAEVAKGHALPMIPFALAVALAYLVLIAAWDTMVLRGCLGRPGFRDILRGRAGTGLLQTLGYAAGGGGYGVWIARKTGARAALAGGLVLYTMASDLAAVCLVASASMFLGVVAAGRGLRIAAPVIALLQIGFVLVGPYRLRGQSAPGVLAPWRMMPRGPGLLQMAGRCLNILVWVVCTWAAERAFGLAIPFGAIATYLPVVLLVRSLPINVAGFGAVQAVWVGFFQPWATGPRILAFQVLWDLMIAAGIVLRGLPFVRGVIAEIDQGQVEAEQKKGPPEAPVGLQAVPGVSRTREPPGKSA